MNARIKVAGLALAATLALASCSSGTATPSAEGTVVTVTEKEFSIELSQSDFTPGTYTFTVDNEGQGPHSLHIVGPGLEDQGTSTIASGGTSSLTVTLGSGSYELYCSLPGHKENGMDITITVS